MVDLEYVSVLRCGVMDKYTALEQKMRRTVLVRHIFIFIMHQSFVSPALLGPGIAGTHLITFMVLILTSTKNASVNLDTPYCQDQQL